jgi:dTDP-4-dehydrorhamnose 3,5-epimerase
LRILPTPLAGLKVIEIDFHRDDRGGFGRSFCKAEFATAGLTFDVVQANLSQNAAAGTLRGMHYQAAPYADAKLVRCVRGRIFDVAVDLRPGSPSQTRWFGIELAPEAPQMLFIPAGFAHGFVSLEPDSDVAYFMGGPFVAEAARGVRWNDPAFGVAWPMAPRHMSPRDAAYPDYVGE